MQRTRPAFAGQRSLAVADQNMALHQVVGPAWAYGRAQLRRRWTSAVVIALLVGTAGGVVLTAYAGARRTDTAYPRYLTATHAADFLYFHLKFRHAGHQHLLSARGGAAAGAAEWCSLRPIITRRLAPVSSILRPQLCPNLCQRRREGRYTVDSLKLLTGRMPHPAGPTKRRPTGLWPCAGICASQHFQDVRRQHQCLGGHSPAGCASRKAADLHYHGIGVSYDEVVPVASNDGLPTLFLTPAYYLAHHTPAETNFDGVAVQLRPGASHSAFDAATTAAWGAAGGQRALNALFVADLTQHYARVERAIKPDGLVLELFALFVAIGALVAIGTSCSRSAAFFS